ncbi:hypothetical protein BC829DRAFT_164683 [Chytridium lagenaria]|nr:hypothetical protein BC829DRAFT_164683 [Chytridium lagenaria]
MVSRKDVMRASAIGKIFQNIENGLDHSDGLSSANVETKLNAMVSKRNDDPYDPFLVDHFERLVQARTEFNSDLPLDVDTIAYALCDVALLKGSFDDVTALVVEIPSLQGQSQKEGGISSIRVFARDIENSCWRWVWLSSPLLPDPIDPFAVAAAVGMKTDLMEPNTESWREGLKRFIARVRDKSEAEKKTEKNELRKELTLVEEDQSLGQELCDIKNPTTSASMSFESGGEE